jgi:hypothetical protein
LKSHQFPARHEQVGQSTSDKKPIGILCHAALAPLGKCEDAFDHSEGMLHFGAHAAVLIMARLDLAQEDSMTRRLRVFVKSSSGKYHLFYRLHLFVLPFRIAFC